MMRVFAKKSFQFDHPTDENQKVTVQALDFANVPDWVVDSTMFKLASAEGSVDVVDGKTQEAVAEKAATDPVLNQLKARAKELGVPKYTKLNAEELLAAIEEAAKASAGNNTQNPPDGTGNPPAGDPPAGDNTDNTGS